MAFDAKNTYLTHLNSPSLIHVVATTYPARMFVAEDRDGNKVDEFEDYDENLHDLVEAFSRQWCEADNT